jgi:hypothetical protein
MRFAILVVAALLASRAAAQAPADFSGQWIVQPVPPSGDMGSGWGPTITITQSATELVVEPDVYSRYDLQPQPRFAYALDGSQTRQTLMLGRGVQTPSSRAAWQGTSLRLTTVHAYADPASGKPLTIDVTQTLTLASPTTLVVEATRGGALGGRPSTTKTVYTKR